jgi:uncharacterized protein (TIGR00255 family)
MISMTGFASKETQNVDVAITIEIKSYNNRYLDIKHNMPSLFSIFEQEIDNKIKEVVVRGSVEINIRYKQFKNTTQLIVNEDMVREYKKAFDTISQVAQTKERATLSDFAQLEGVITTSNVLDPHYLHAPLFSLLDEVLIDFKEVREKEGEGTLLHIESLISQMKQSVSEIKGYSKSIEEKLKENLTKKMTELMEDREYDKDRFLQEIAILLIKYSIEEELQRLTSHFIAFDAIMHEKGAVGKKLDFLCQEMNREINTIGSKSMIGEVNQLVVSLKDNLENIREQLRNIE